MSSRVIDDVTGEVIAPGAATGPVPAPGEGRFKLGVAGYDLWPHAINFCHALKDADFVEIAAVWDDEPAHLARLVEITGAKGYDSLEEFCRSEIGGAVITARTSER